MKYIDDLKKILGIISNEERHQLAILFVLMIVGMLLETFGIAIIVPFVGLLAQGDYVEKFPQLAPWLEKIGNPDQISLVIMALLALVVFYLIKNSFLVFLAWKQSRFSSRTLANLSSRLFDLYLHQPYTFHLQHNSAQLIRNAINEIGAFGMYGLNASLLLVTELFVLLGVLTLLLYIEPIGTITAISIMGIVVGIYHYFTKHLILKWGEARQIHEGMRLKHIQQGLGGSKIVKLAGCENNFLEQYKFHTIAGAHVGQRQSFVSQLPKYLIEVVSIISLTALIIVIVIEDNSTENIMPILSLFAMAAFRLMPSVNRIIFAIQNLKYGVPVINLLHKELSTLEKINTVEEKNNLEFNKILELKKVTYFYPNTEKKSLENITLSIEKGETVGFIGESGAGKSTVSDIVLGLLTPTSGKILVDKMDIHKNIRTWQKQIGYVPQSIYLTDDTLRRNIAFGLKDEEIDDDKIWHVLKVAQLDDFIKKSSDGLDTFVGERGVRLSGGQQQRIGIARAMYHDPSLLVLDEATSSLDNATEARFMETIKKLYGSKTVIIIAHRLSTVQDCDRVYRFQDGSIIEAGNPDEVL